MVWRPPYILVKYYYKYTLNLKTANQFLLLSLTPPHHLIHEFGHQSHWIPETNGTSCIPVLMPKKGKTSSTCVNCNSICHSPMEGWSRYSPHWQFWKLHAELCKATLWMTSLKSMFKGALFAQMMLWWSDCSSTRRVNMQSKEYLSQNPDPTLESWDEWYTFEHIQQPLQLYHEGWQLKLL